VVGELAGLLAPMMTAVWGEEFEGWRAEAAGVRGTQMAGIGPGRGGLITVVMFACVRL
jgi:hypothetical protein